MVWEAADYFGFPFGKIVKLLVLTGQRRQEMTGMRWSELNDDLLDLESPAFADQEQEAPRRVRCRR